MESKKINIITSLLTIFVLLWAIVYYVQELGVNSQKDQVIVGLLGLSAIVQAIHLISSLKRTK